MPDVAVDLTRVTAFIPAPLSVPLLAFWKESGVDLECWEYDAGGTPVQLLATTPLSWAPAGSFPTEGENLAHRSCFVSSGADPSNALLVMVDEVADVIAIWDIASKSLVTTTLIQQASPTSVSTPQLCGNFGGGVAYVAHREFAVTPSGEETVYVQKIDKDGATLVGSIVESPVTGSIDLEMHGFYAGAVGVGDAFGVFYVDKAEAHFMQLPGGGVVVKTGAGRTGDLGALGTNFFVRSNVAGPGSVYPDALFPHSAVAALATVSYSVSADFFVTGGTQVTSGAVPVDAAETNAASLNKSGSAIAVYEFDRTGTPTGRIKYQAFPDLSDASWDNLDPSTVIRATDWPISTDARMPHFMQAFGVEPVFP